MNNPGEKIKQIRLTKGISQEELAEMAKVNLRTIQRLENNESIPRGQTLQLVCNALEIKVESLSEYGKKNDSGFLAAFYLSILSFFVIPLGNIFVPFILWLIKKDKITGLREKGKKVILLQVIWTLLSFFLFFLFFYFIILDQTAFRWGFVHLFLISILLNVIYACYFSIKEYKRGLSGV
jgi:transcriptional regulator with XRE-family HTH domain